MRIGILGGTFNPPHLGHLVVAQEAHRELDLDQVLFIPAATPPHKPVEDEPGARHRLELCRLAVGDDDRFGVSDIELQRDGPSYTVDTLHVLRTHAPSDDLFLILGGDIAAGLPRWHEPERVLELATVAIAKRRGTSQSTVDEALAQLQGGERARFFQMPRIGISSTMVRRRVRAGQPIRYFVPDGVMHYIETQGLYRPTGGK
ncbi:MAG TPA: nicotinate-nucleotide adenylyltransferase [Solirubrobacteraceae bacterium]|jgi:nicotinate-nucleotide adenylyltransferase|nr:nicotinate-nucleotide adenylyltransferase [Solirubrobacteraceae bacterium]